MMKRCTRNAHSFLRRCRERLCVPSSLVTMSEIDNLVGLQVTSKDAKALIPVLISLFRESDAKHEKMLNDMKNEFLEAVRQKDVTIENLSNEVSSLKKRVSKLEERIEENDQYERRDTLIFSGPSLPPSTTNENCEHVIRSAIKNNLNVELSPGEISVAHRLGAKPATQRPDRRSIIVKFCRRNTKVDILSSARTKKVPNFFANESLTPLNQTISFVLRKMKKAVPEKISGTTTIDGKNYVWVKSPGARDLRQVISSHERLISFSTDVLRKPLSEFIEIWPH